MSKEELSRKIGEIEKQLMINEDLLRTYQLKKRDDLDSDTWDILEVVATSTTALRSLRAFMADKLREEGVFIV